MNDMANPEYALSLKTYKNTVPCGGYKLTGGGQIGDSVIDVSMINENNLIILQSELLTPSKDDLYYDIKLSIHTALDDYISSALSLKEGLRTNKLDELNQQAAFSILAKGKILNYKDVYNIILHLFGLECDGIVSVSDFGIIGDAYALTTKELLKTINFDSLLSKIVVKLNTLTDEGQKSTTLSMSTNSIAFYPNSIPTPTTGNYIYFGENGNVVHLNINR